MGVGYELVLDVANKIHKDGKFLEIFIYSVPHDDT